MEEVLIRCQEEVVCSTLTGNKGAVFGLIVSRCVRAELWFQVSPGIRGRAQQQSTGAAAC